MTPVIERQSIDIPFPVMRSLSFDKENNEEEYDDDDDL